MSRRGPGCAARPRHATRRFARRVLRACSCRLALPRPRGQIGDPAHGADHLGLVERVEVEFLETLAPELLPATSKAADEAHTAMVLARWARSRTPCAIVCHSSDNWARLSSLSAINSCFRDSSGLM